MSKRPQRYQIASTRRVRGNPHTVSPAPPVRDADSLVYDRPVYGQRLTAESRVRHLEVRHDKVSVRNHHYVEDLVRLPDIVYLRAVFKDLVLDVGCYE